MESGNSTVKTPETESETPARIQPNKLAPSGNGLLLRRAPPPNGHPTVVGYKECQKNHAASLGGHAVDGCGEFMPSLTYYSGDPASFNCVACGCHRNFHRRQPDEPVLVPSNPAPPCPAADSHSHQRHRAAPAPPPPRANVSGGSPNVNSPDSPPPISSSYVTSGPHMLLALSHGLSSPPPDGSSPISAPAPAPAPAKTTSRTPPANSSGRKRFRSRFTVDQKDKMLEFSDSLGWKMQKKDDDLIREFCAEIGVEKGVLKVWMHNNKSAFCTRPVHLSSSVSANITDISAPPPDAANGKFIYSDFISPAPPNYPLEDDSTDDSAEQEERKQEMNHHHLRD